MHYYRDRVTRSIYSARELAELAKAGGLTPRELLVHFDELPEQKRRLLEETEAAASRKRQEQHPGRSPKRTAGWPRFYFPSL